MVDEIHELTRQNYLNRIKNQNKLINALEQKVKELSWDGALDSAEEKIQKLKEQNRKLRDCVEFYADKNNWFENGEKMAIQKINQKDLDRYYYGGKLARETLVKIKGDKNE